MSDPVRKLLYLLLFLGLAYLGVTYYLSGLILQTPHRPLESSKQISLDRWGFDVDSALQTLPPYRAFLLEDANGDSLLLRGWTIDQPGGSTDCAVVFAHGYGGTRADMVKYTRPFHRCGCDLYLYDHRGHAESGEAYAGGGYLEARDMAKVVRYAARRSGLPIGRVGLFGESWGAATALLTPQFISPRDTTLRPAWIIAESPFTDWRTAVMERGVKQYGDALKFFAPGVFTWVGRRNGMNFDDASPLKAVREHRIPTLLFHSQQDTFTNPEQSRLIYEADPEDITYHPLDWGAWHAHNVIWRREEYEGLIEDFLGNFCE